MRLARSIVRPSVKSRALPGLLCVLLSFVVVRTASSETLFYDRQTRTASNPSQDVVQFYPSMWPRTDQDVANLAPSSSIRDVIRYVNQLGFTPVNGPASDENH